MPRVMKGIAAVSLLLTPVMLALYARFEMGLFLSMGDRLSFCHAAAGGLVLRPLHGQPRGRAASLVPSAQL